MDIYYNRYHICKYCSSFILFDLRYEKVEGGEEEKKDIHNSSEMYFHYRLESKYGRI